VLLEKCTSDMAFIWIGAARVALLHRERMPYGFRSGSAQSPAGQSPDLSRQLRRRRRNRPDTIAVFGSSEDSKDDPEM
jgi:hypothetical protein